MYIDSLTITALVIFFIFFALFVKFCLLKVCGGTPRESREDSRDRVEDLS